ncbi:MAG TPA: hypothetical protein VGK72_03920 [Chthoniobacterales bacterium]
MNSAISSFINLCGIGRRDLARLARLTNQPGCFPASKHSSIREHE